MSKLPLLHRFPVPPGNVRFGTMAVLPDLLREFDVEPEPILKELGLSLEFFADINHSIPFDKQLKLLARCASQTACDHFGLLIGQRLNHSHLGIIGYLFIHSPDVRSALNTLVNFSQLQTRGAAVSFVEDKNGARFTYFAHINPRLAEQNTYGALAVIVNMMRRICGKSWAPDEVSFAFPQPDDIKPFQQFFKSKVRFGTEQTVLLLTKQTLDQKNADADPVLMSLLLSMAEIIKSKGKDDLVAEVSQSIIRLFPTHKLTVDQVAGQIGLHPRTLNRRLKERGTTFTSILNNIRLEYAAQLLSDRKHSVTDVGMMLGYTTPSAFTRACRQLIGKSPRDWRKELQKPASPD